MAKTLLLADDSVTIQKVVGISFAGEDVDLITVDNGDDAITKAREARPDIVLTDVVMPGKNGYEVCEAIKTDPALAHIPVLLLTGTFEAFDEERATRCGAAGHVAKPFEAQTLVDRVAQLLANPPPPAPAPAESAPITEPQIIGQTPIAQRPAAESASTADSINDQSFDFFDDELAAPPPPSVASAPAGAVDFDAADHAFAFGDDDIGAAAPSGDHTVAMIPDDSDPSFAAPQATSFDAAPAAPRAEDELLSSPIEAPGAPTDRFEFEAGDNFGESDLLAPLSDDELGQETILDPKGASGYDVSSSDLRDPPVPGPDTLEPIPAAVEATPQPIREDATVMVSDMPPAAPAPDPAQIGSDLFADDEPLSPAPPTDVGRDTLLESPEPAPMLADDPSLDAMIPAAPEPTPPVAAPEPMAFEEPPAPPPVPAAQPMPAAPVAAEPRPAPMPIAEPPAAPEPVATAEPIAPPFAEPMPEPMAPPMPEPVAQPMPEPMAPPTAQPVPEPMAPPAAQPVPEPMAPPTAQPIPVAQPVAAAEPAPGPLSGPDTAAVADAVMAGIEPHLREHLHDTLEKIAWESFGDVTEQIVRQALEHVERVAWEVIPQMAETMIREEIKKLKGEG